ncbi:MAG: class II aldolase/adducin family protein [Firmicutes bacterium]|jgi:L-fuculose-phosphate aldolase|nr:class II aldolase/adducin family protein [Bacillota bacterium]
MNDQALREKVIQTSRLMLSMGLTNGTSGNVSARCEDGTSFLITPSGMDYDAVTPDDIVKVSVATGETTGRRVPSIETGLHRGIHLSRPDAGAIVHVHSPLAAGLAVARKPLPVIADMCALAFGGQVEVAEYGTSGSPELAANVVRALGNRNAVFMANHGSLGVGKDLDQALFVCDLLEKMCLTYYCAILAGGAVPITDEAIEKLKRGIGKTYGQPGETSATAG